MCRCLMQISKNCRTSPSRKVSETYLSARSASETAVICQAVSRTSPRSLAAEPARLRRAAGRAEQDLYHYRFRSCPERNAEEQVDQKTDWCRSSPTKRVLSVWKVCSVELVFTRRSAVHPRRTAQQVAYYKRRKVRFCRKGSTSWALGVLAGSGDLSYSTNNLPMIPFCIYYSMFGFQRIGDLCWAAGDQQARGFPDRYFRSYHPERRRSAF